MTSTYGTVFLESLGLEKSRWLEKLGEAVTIGSYLHDIGKANHQFQRLVSTGCTLPQAFRHESISLLLALKWKPLASLIQRDEDVVYASLFAASGHHLKFDDPEMQPRPGSGDSKIILYTGHNDMKELLERGRQIFSLPLSTEALNGTRVDLFGDPMKDVKAWLRSAVIWWRESDDELKRFVALVKALVIGSDLAASAVLRNADPVKWTDSVLGRVCRRDDLLGAVGIALKDKPLRTFQEVVARTPSRVTFVHAGCGSGKTVAAYLWAAEKAQGRKVFFCYPTTGTATQGYMDYAIGNLHSRLIHSRSEVDIEMMRESKGDQIDALEPAIRYEALSAWDTPVVVATADAVLGLIQNNRRGLFSFPSIGNGAFVFDEVHAYDERLFGALLRFMGTFVGPPILLMTASLQRERLRRIEGILSRRGETMNVVRGPEEFERAKRYTIHGTESSEPWEEVAKVVRGGGKVLWVANTVERARAVWEEACGKFEPILYHSRYRYVDRVRHHEAVIDSFRKEGSAFAVTTQVCEVSLDISADMLVTDLAPVAALIQRMGRVNRGAHVDGPKPVHIVGVSAPEPYSAEEFVTARKWLKRLVEDAGSTVSQADLSNKFLSCEEGHERGSVDSSWLDGGPFSRPSPLREEGYTVSVLMQEDREKCIGKEGRVMNAEVAKYSIPMPFWPVRQELPGWERVNGAFVAPQGAVGYSEELGGSWTR